MYDTHSRLLSGQVKVGAGIATQSYAYDTYGNITSITTNPVLGSDRSNMSFNNRNQLTAPTGYTYDDAGNVTATSGGLAFTWDRIGSMATKTMSGATETYIYAPGGERIATFTSTGSTRFLRAPDGTLLRELAGTGTRGSETITWTRDYVNAGRVLLATIDTSGTRHYHLDHLGSPRLITDDQGFRLFTRTLYPYGQDADVAGSDTFRLKFTGHERDDQVGGVNDLDYMHARYYDTLTARFTSPDPLGDGYRYVNGQPLVQIDPFGLRPADPDVTVTGEDPCPQMPDGLDCEGNPIDPRAAELRRRFLEDFHALVGKGITITVGVAGGSYHGAGLDLGGGLAMTVYDPEDGDLLDRLGLFGGLNGGVGWEDGASWSIGVTRVNGVEGLSSSITDWNSFNVNWAKYLPVGFSASFSRGSWIPTAAAMNFGIGRGTAGGSLTSGSTRVLSAREATAYLAAQGPYRSRVFTPPSSTFW